LTFEKNSKLATKRRKSLEEDGIRNSQCNWEDATKRHVELGEDDKKPVTTNF
jgi:hypothetical protein